MGGSPTKPNTANYSQPATTESPMAKKLEAQRKQYEGQQLESMSTAFSNADAPANSNHPNALGRDAKSGQFNGVKAQPTNKSNINTTADEAMMDL
jgi:hypothetical protein